MGDDKRDGGGKGGCGGKGRRRDDSEIEWDQKSEIPVHPQ